MNIPQLTGQIFLPKFRAIFSGQFSGLCYTYPAPGDTALTDPAQPTATRTAAMNLGRSRLTMN